VSGLFSFLMRLFQCSFGQVRQRLMQWTRPTSHSHLWGMLNDLTRTRAELIPENALLRQQLIMLRSR
jgi:hypothetical protein